METSHQFRQAASYFTQSYGEEAILAILAYGSRITNHAAVDAFSDYDLSIIFREYPDKDVDPLPPEFDVSTYVWKDIATLGSSNFFMDGKGVHSLYFLATATPLHGTNPFVGVLAMLDQEILRQDLKRQIIAHCWALGDLAICGQHERKARDIAKYSFRIAKNCYLSDHPGADPFLHQPYSAWLDRLASCDSLTGYPMNYLNTLCEGQVHSITSVFQFVQCIKQKVGAPARLRAS